MASKGSGKEKAVDTDEVLQAVVIAESFNVRFQPLTANKPRVSATSKPLCTLSNVPLAI